MRQTLSEDLEITKDSSKMVPRILTAEQKQSQLPVSSHLLNNVEMFGRIITGDETLKKKKNRKQNTGVFCENQITKVEKACMSCSQFKFMPAGLS